mgnify:CR=1 FL=1
MTRKKFKIRHPFANLELDPINPIDRETEKRLIKAVQGVLDAVQASAPKEDDEDNESIPAIPAHLKKKNTHLKCVLI